MQSSVPSGPKGAGGRKGHAPRRRGALRGAGRSHPGGAGRGLGEDVEPGVGPSPRQRRPRRRSCFTGVWRTSAWGAVARQSGRESGAGITGSFGEEKLISNKEPEQVRCGPFPGVAEDLR
ncbi:glycine-rich protein 1-like [Dromaius novaehollandiae]|uniref:glycine-rich protein 1-like n=1 Tax=Dromaius novaehollandiae TaxID=8790 RepID=UPI00311D61A0